MGGSYLVTMMPDCIQMHWESMLIYATYMEKFGVSPSDWLHVCEVCGVGSASTDLQWGAKIFWIRESEWGVGCDLLAMDFPME